MTVYLDRNDWWVGYYRGGSHHYVCPLPCVVIRWPRNEARVLRRIIRKVERQRQRMFAIGVPDSQFTLFLGNATVTLADVKARLAEIERDNVEGPW